MNPLLLVGADLFFSACLTFLVFYVIWRKIQPYMPPVKHTLKKDAAEEEILRTKEDKGAEPGEPIDDFEDGDITERVERLKEKGFSVEKISGKLKVPTGEIEMVLALSEMKNLKRGVSRRQPSLKPNGKGANRRQPPLHPGGPQRPAEKEKMQRYPLTVRGQQQKEWFNKQPL